MSSEEIEKLKHQIAVLQRKLSREQLARTAAEDMLNNYSRDAYLANQNLRKALSETRAIYHNLLAQLPQETADTLAEKPVIDQHANMVDRMTLLSQLAAGIAHEINNPIGFIKSNCEIQGYMLKDVFDAWDEVKNTVSRQQSELSGQIFDIELKYMLSDIREMLEDIERSSLEGVNRIAEIVSSIQIFSSPVGTEKDFITLEALVDYCTAECIRSLPESVTLDVSSLSDAPEVLVNQKQVKQVFDAVIENAIDACKPKGIIGVKFAVLPGLVKLFIHDTGSGIKAEHLPLIFTPFFTTKPPGEGTGLGLSVAQALMEVQNGWLQIDSQDGQGTTVTLNFPIQ
ncbi:ATP-binding protein [Aestuariibacter sp. A3R04]|uniref:sensor histidine kinase n=1 Tax=Aestuariibacter sp. A3R04 TaxID=2841571 RepID=UPI001C0849E6|nr:HAMP domain-containing histidine kinase [Aestuariibacter sp. A3R04]